MTMGSWTSKTTFVGDAERVLELLTDPEEAQAWAPVEFTVEDAEGRRLHTGDVAHIAGQLAGRRMSFDIEVFKASEGQLRLRATGPVEIEVEYGVVSRDDGSGELTAWIAVSSAGGLMGRLVASATDTVLAAGALDAAVRKIAAAAEGDSRH